MLVRLRFGRLAACLLLCLPSQRTLCQSSPSKPYVVTHLGTLNPDKATSASLIPVALNNRAQAVGMNSENWNVDPYGGLFAVLWSPAGGMTQLTPVPDSGMPTPQQVAYVYGLNDRGMAVGLANHACLWDEDGGIHDLGTLGGDFSYATAINNAGQIAGNSRTAGTSWEMHGFFYSGGVMKDIGTFPMGNKSVATGINNAGIVCGYAELPITAPSPNGFPRIERAFLYDGEIHELGVAGEFTRAAAINNSGHVVGTSETWITNTIGTRQGFFFKDGITTFLGDVYPLAMNDNDQVVGWYWKWPEGQQRAFLWENGVMRDVGSLLPSGSPWFAWKAVAINNRGQILCLAYPLISYRPYNWSAILLSPNLGEPTTSLTVNGPTGGGGWYTGPTQVTLSATDPDGPDDIAATFYAIDGGPRTRYTGPFTVSSEGAHVVEAWSVDMAGANESPHRTVAVNVDSTGPSITATADPSEIRPPNGGLVPVTVSGRMLDGASGIDATTAAYAVTDEYGLIQPTGPITLDAEGRYSFTVLLEARRDGMDFEGRAYTIRVAARDRAGNAGVITVRVIVPHD